MSSLINKILKSPPARQKARNNQKALELLPSALPRELVSHSRLHSMRKDRTMVLEVASSVHAQLVADCKEDIIAKLASSGLMVQEIKTRVSGPNKF